MDRADVPPSSDVLRIDVDDLRLLDAPALRTSEYLAVLVEGDVRVHRGATTVVVIDSCSAVELRQALAAWLAGGEDAGDFAYDAMDAEEVDLLWLRRADDGTWSVGSPWGEAVVHGVPSAEVFTAARSYVAEVDRWLHEQLGRDASGRPTRFSVVPTPSP